MSDRRPAARGTTVCLIDTQTHALAARAMRHSLAAMDFADALFLSDSDADTGGARHVPIPPFSGREDYSRFVIKDLLPHLRTEHLLLIQWDGYVINPAAWSDEFLRYDYIGARWGFHDDPHCVGNGGFSLRSRRLLEALQDPEINRFEPEDIMICRNFRPLLERRYGIRFAPPEIADRFSFETTYPNPEALPLGFHGLFNMWLFVDDTAMPAFVEAMPRPVLGSLQALALARNLRDLKRTGSARLLLERRLHAFPADDRASELLASLSDRPATGTTPAVGRNEPCPCGSGKRYKHCCGTQRPATQAAAPAGPGPRAGHLLEQALGAHQAGRLDEARELYRAVLALAPDAIAEHYLGVLDMQQGDPVAGEARIRAALAARDDLPDFHNNLGLCLRAQGRLEEAVEAYRRALDLNPSYAPAWSNIGLDRHKLGQLDLALDAFNRALALAPDLAQARFSRALVLLQQGDYAKGWAEYEWRARCPEHAGAYRLPPLPAPPTPWQGEPLAGRSLLLIAEQGIGDTLQFVRYVRQLADQGARVGLYLRKPHVAVLLDGVPGLAAVHAGDLSEPLPAYDHLCHLLSLPRLCGTRSPDQVPAPVPYLFPAEARRSYWRQRLAALPGRLSIGLAWAGSPGNPDDRHRSCPLAALLPLFDLPDIDWVSLQLGAGREQLREADTPVLDWGDEQTDYAETAALMAELDLVLSVDTSVAHAAGALGRPVWVMLSRIPDFRWLLDRDDSPWYPSARLFRQSDGGDWATVVARMRAALAERLAAGEAR